MMPTIEEAIENALTYIETKNGHRYGAIYEDLAQVLKDLCTRTIRSRCAACWRKRGEPLTWLRNRTKTEVIALVREMERDPGSEGIIRGGIQAALSAGVLEAALDEFVV